MAQCDTQKLGHGCGRGFTWKLTHTGKLGTPTNPLVGEYSSKWLALRFKFLHCNRLAVLLALAGTVIYVLHQPFKVDIPGGPLRIANTSSSVHAEAFHWCSFISCDTYRLCNLVCTSRSGTHYIIPLFYQLWYYNVQRCNVAHVSPSKTISLVLPTVAVKCNVQRCNIAHKISIKLFPSIMPELPHPHKKVYT